jgi:hypothetical protein
MAAEVLRESVGCPLCPPGSHISSIEGHVDGTHGGLSPGEAVNLKTFFRLRVEIEG